MTVPASLPRPSSSDEAEEGKRTERCLSFSADVQLNGSSMAVLSMSEHLVAARYWVLVDVAHDAASVRSEATGGQHHHHHPAELKVVVETEDAGADRTAGRGVHVQAVRV